ncbi:hypothetical protein C2G38_2137353 [Gigaspora rosea]|uniref:Uncharacterized protein n=1 Tax=Gigaspora rosea TaxID=44941 RepID=A0A397W2U0_9GLOM|nr:hypothetical protein C2G38_2137353 [Gigaspora rosea]
MQLYFSHKTWIQELQQDIQEYLVRENVTRRLESIKLTTYDPGKSGRGFNNPELKVYGACGFGFELSFIRLIWKGNALQEMIELIFSINKKLDKLIDSEPSHIVKDFLYY